MDVKRVDANLLVALEAILTERNLTRAGARLDMTQPAMSGALARLREQIGDPLLTRVGRSYELTPRAVQLLPIVRDAVAAVSRTLQVRPDFDPATATRTFTVAASDYATSVLAAALFEAIRDEAPGVSVAFVPLPLHESLAPEHLLKNDLVIGPAGRGTPGRRQRVFSDRLVALVDRNHPALRGGRLSLDDLSRSRWVSGVFGGFSTPADDLLADHDIVPDIAFTCPGFLPLPFFLPRTDLIALVPGRVAASTAAALQLVVAETDLAETLLAETAHWHPNSSADPGLQWLLGVLRRLSRTPDGIEEGAA